MVEDFRGEGGCIGSPILLPFYWYSHDQYISVFLDGAEGGGGSVIIGGRRWEGCFDSLLKCLFVMSI